MAVAMEAVVTTKTVVAINNKAVVTNSKIAVATNNKVVAINSNSSSLATTLAVVTKVVLKVMAVSNKEVRPLHLACPLTIKTISHFNGAGGF